MATLPFLLRGTLKDQQGDTLAEDMPCQIWPAAQGTTGTAGRHYFFRGEAELSFYSLLRGDNRILTIDGEDYRVLTAIPHSIVPHVAMELRRSEPTGAH